LIFPTQITTWPGSNDKGAILELGKGWQLAALVYLKNKTYKNWAYR